MVLRGWHYPPQGVVGSAPVIVMFHGFAGVKEMRLDAFAEVFAQAGLGVLVYDHRNTGASDGQPRQEIDPWAQLHDVRDAITFAETLPGADPERIGLWGSSYGGGHAIVVAGIDPRVKCIVSQVPAVAGVDGAPPELVGLLLADRRQRFKGADPGMITIVSNDPGTPCLFTTPDAWEATQVLTPSAPNFRNEVTLRSVEYLLEYKPRMFVGMVSPVPFMMIVAENDLLTPTGEQLEAFAAAGEPKKLVVLKGGHFDPYVRLFDEASQAARDWLLEHLCR